MTNTKNKDTQEAEGTPILAMVIIGGSALLTLTILVLSIRWLYHTGSPKKC